MYCEQYPMLCGIAVLSAFSATNIGKIFGTGKQTGLKYLQYYKWYYLRLMTMPLTYTASCPSILSNCRFIMASPPISMQHFAA